LSRGFSQIQEERQRDRNAEDHEPENGEPPCPTEDAAFMDHIGEHHGCRDDYIGGEEFAGLACR
jgi:hypothetical protein